MSGLTLERVGFLLIAACLGVIQLNIIAGQGVLFTLAGLVWIAVLVRDRRWPATPAFFLPLVVYALLTLASAAASIDPKKSFIDSRQLLLFLMVPIVARLARGRSATTVIDVIIAIGSAGALVGIVQYALLGYDHLQQRPHGLLGHYMTYSGVLMLVTCAAVARLLYHPKEWIWPAVAVPALLVALAVTFGRAAWVGTFLAVLVLVAMRNWRLVVLVPVLAGLGLVIAPSSIRARALSSFNSQDASRRDRAAMIEIGKAMVRDHPVFGVGPEMIESEYPKYRPATAVNPTNQHLHNVPVQIAAERGLLALGAWIWFVVIALRDLFKQVRRGPARAVAGAGLAAVVGMIGAGFLEYNFGDSEFLMLLLGLMTLPFAAASGDGENAAS
jgi:putative inorganic carbon (HCO3(-)) transporter